MEEVVPEPQPQHTQQAQHEDGQAGGDIATLVQVRLLRQWGSLLSAVAVACWLVPHSAGSWYSNDLLRQTGCSSAWCSSAMWPAAAVGCRGGLVRQCFDALRSVVTAGAPQ